MFKYFSHDINKVQEELKSDINNGISDKEAQIRLDKNGENKLIGKKDKSLMSMLAAQFKDYLVIILLVAAVISFIEGSVIDATVIIVIVIINAVLGITQERKASDALKALKEMSSPSAKVIRNGNLIKISSDLVVVGDIVLLEAGDYIPADLRLIESINMKVDEAALTGESVSVEKKADVILSEDASLGDRINSASMGTVVTYGRGKGMVVATGMNTHMGNIANMLAEDDEGTTPLQKKLDSLGKMLGMLCIGICLVIFLLGWIQGYEISEIFMISVSLAVAAIPEGLTVIVTVILALGMQEMVKINAIVKKLSAVETLGSTTTICSDKTGTLTQNKMTVVKLYDTNEQFSVTGTGYNSKGDILDSNSNIYNIKENKNIQKLLEGCVLCNDSQYKSEVEQIIGDPTEGALVVLGHKLGYTRNELNEKYPRIDEMPFDSDRKLMSTMHSIDGKNIIYTKGAPDEVLLRSKFIYKNGEILEISDDDRKLILENNNTFATEALRVLAIAFKQNESLNNEDDLVFVGLLGMIDPPREEAKDAIAICKKAGITVKMITGDHKTTATAIAKQLGIPVEDGAVEGKEIELMSDEKLQEVVKTINIFARVSPEHKVRLVKAVKNNGGVVAMTGDGVNDAPSLKKADIGIAMGITGTDVSKEAADIILTDDNFATIVKAVEQGRGIYNNIRKVVGYLLSCNIGEILVIFLAMIFRLPVPLQAIHLLSINLVTDSFPAFALGMEKNTDPIMDIEPRDPDASIVDSDMRIAILIQSIALVAGALGSFVVCLNMFGYEVATTACFTTLVVGELLRAYSSRSETTYIHQAPIFSNSLLNKSVIFSLLFLLLTIYTPLNAIFSNVMLTWEQMLIALSFSILPLIGGEVSKYFRKIF